MHPLRKRQLLDADHLTLPEAYEQAAHLMEPALASAGHREGVQAFRERRPPRFAPLVSGWQVIARSAASATCYPGAFNVANRSMAAAEAL